MKVNPTYLEEESCEGARHARLGLVTHNLVIVDERDEGVEQGVGDDDASHGVTY